MPVVEHDRSAFAAYDEGWARQNAAWSGFTFDMRPDGVYVMKKAGIEFHFLSLKAVYAMLGLKRRGTQGVSTWQHIYHSLRVKMQKERRACPVYQAYRESLRGELRKQFPVEEAA